MTDQTTTIPVSPAPVAKKHQMSFTVLEDGTIRASFGEGVEPLTLGTAEIPEVLHAAAMTEGVISRVRSYTNKLEGADRTPEKLREQVLAGFTAMRAGQWKTERTASDDYTIEQEAAHLFRIMRAKAKNEEFTGTLAESAATFANLTDDTETIVDGKTVKVLGEKSQLKALPRFKLAYAEIKAKRDAEKLAKLAAKVTADEAEGLF